jgi:hypothetical protein
VSTEQRFLCFGISLMGDRYIDACVLSMISYTILTLSASVSSL